MDSSDSDAPGDSDVDDSAENNPGPGKKKMSRFSVAQNACLNAYYSSGMRGIGKKYSSQIVQAASDSQLTTLQVIVSTQLPPLQLKGELVGWGGG